MLNVYRNVKPKCHHEYISHNIYLMRYLVNTIKSPRHHMFLTISAKSSGIEPLNFGAISSGEIYEEYQTKPLHRTNIDIMKRYKELLIMNHTV